MDRSLAVITPAASTDLTTIDRMKVDLGISGSAEDTKLAALVKASSRAVVGLVRGELISETVAETFRAYPATDSLGLTNRAEHLWLARTPVTSITSVSEDDVALTVDEYEWTKAGKLLRLWNGAPVHWTFEKLVVTYVGGYVLGSTLPEDIQVAALEWAKELYRVSTVDRMVRSEKLDNVSEISWFSGANAEAIPPLVPILLAPYMRSPF